MDALGMIETRGWLAQSRRQMQWLKLQMYI